jgi:hypothetical protein
MQEYNFSTRKKNLIILALLLHDSYKLGLTESEHTVDEHPVIASKQILSNRDLRGVIPTLDVITICWLILTHMGQWNRNHDKKVIMPKPITKAQKFVHLCDYLASRKCLEFTDI